LRRGLYGEYGNSYVFFAPKYSEKLNIYAILWMSQYKKLVSINEIYPWTFLKKSILLK